MLDILQEHAWPYFQRNIQGKVRILFLGRLKINFMLIIYRDRNQACVSTENPLMTLRQRFREQ